MKILLIVVLLVVSVVDSKVRAKERTCKLVSEGYSASMALQMNGTFNITDILENPEAKESSKKFWVEIYKNTPPPHNPSIGYTRTEIRTVSDKYGTNIYIDCISNKSKYGVEK